MSETLAALLVGGLTALAAIVAGYSKWQARQLADKDLADRKAADYEKVIQINDEVAADRASNWSVTIAKLRTRAKD